jgi:hypothetical protein
MMAYQIDKQGKRDKKLKLKQPLCDRGCCLNDRFQRLSYLP